MVTTRRQTQSLENEEVTPEVIKALVNGGGKKRQSRPDAKSLNEGKRRKLQGGKSDHSIEGDDGHREVRQVEEPEGAIVDQEDTVGRNGAGVNGDAELSLKDPVGVEAPLETPTSIQSPQPKSRTGEKRQSSKKMAKEDMDTTSLTNGHSSLSSTKRQHVRFGSEEPKELPMNDTGSVSQDTGTIQNGTANLEASDSEDAPETMRNLSELKKVHAESLKAAQAQESEQQSLRRKRQERQAKLKDQATNKKRNKKLPIGNSEDGKNEEELPADAIGPESQLPDLLPEHVLNAIPQKQRFDQPLGPLKDSKSHKKHATYQSKAPKDIAVGKTTIRISQSTTLPSSLPPKPSQSSKNVRESWLSSLRGVTTGGTRRTPTKFARK